MSIFLAKDLDSVVSKTKGTDVFNKMLLSQYTNSPNINTYASFFLGEFDFLFEQIEKVYLGRFLEYATGTQLTVLGDLIGINRELSLDPINFGFIEDLGAGLFGTSSDSNLGDIWASTSPTKDLIQLDDEVFKRAVRAKAMCNGTKTQDVEFMYEVIYTILGVEPEAISLKAELEVPETIFFGFDESEDSDSFGSVSDKCAGAAWCSLSPTLEYVVGNAHRITLWVPLNTNNVSLNLIKALKPYFIPAGYQLVIKFIPPIAEQVPVVLTPEPEEEAVELLYGIIASVLGVRPVEAAFDILVEYDNTIFFGFDGSEDSDTFGTTGDDDVGNVWNSVTGSIRQVLEEKFAISLYVPTDIDQLSLAVLESLKPHFEAFGHELEIIFV